RPARGAGARRDVALDDLDLLTAGARPDVAVVAQDFSPAITLASFQQPAARPAVVAEEGEKARALLDKVIAAKGGLTALGRLKSITAITAATMTGPSGTVDSQTTTYLEYPNRVRVETRLAQGSQIQIYDGEHGWVRDPFGIHDVPDAALREMA